MNQPEVLTITPAEPTRRLGRRRYRLVALAILVVGIVAGFFWYDSVNVEERLRQAIAETEQLDPHWTFPDVEAQRRVIPDEENSIVLLMSVRQLLPRPTPKEALQLYEDLEKLAPAKQLNAQQMAAVKEHVGKATQAIERARQLADMPHGRYALAYTPDLISTMLPHCEALTAAQTWLWLDIWARIQDTDLDGAMGSGKALFNCARAMGDEPFPISQMVRMVRERQALHALERILAHGEPSEPSLADFQRMLEEEEAYPSLLIAARGERAVMDALMRKLEAGELKLSNLRRAMGFARGFRTRYAWVDDVVEIFSPSSVKNDHAALLRHMTQCVEAARLPVEDQDPAFATIEKQRKDLPSLASFLFPFLGQVAQTYKQSRAELRCAAAAIAAERYRRQHGEWPRSLDALVPAFLSQMPLDPYDKCVLRMKRIEDGLVIYAIGPDLQDNDGYLTRTHPPPPGSDVGFRLWDVPARRQPPEPVIETPEQESPP